MLDSGNAASNRQGIPKAMARISGAGFLFAGFLGGGCASPGPPQPPSLYIPQRVTDLSATRTGEVVELRFTVPGFSTDGPPLRGGPLGGVLCRQDAKGAPCRPVDAQGTAQPLPLPGSHSGSGSGSGTPSPVVWTDALPESLRTGAVRPIAYRVKLEKASGGSAGFSDPVYTAAGTAPPPVRDFRGEGTRLGVLLRWAPAAGAGEVRLRRIGPEKASVSPKGRAGSTPPPAATAANREKGHGRGMHGDRTGAGRGDDTGNQSVWLQAAPGASGAGATIDNSIEPGVPYRYMAIRRLEVQVGGRMLELESNPSTEVTITWHDVYAPAAPTGLTALGYEVPLPEPQQKTGYAVDLVWEPVEDGQLAGYLVYRQPLSAGEAPPQATDGTQLTRQTVATPGFHDATALPGQRYRYSVVAVGSNGQRSGAATAVVEPHVLP